MPVVKLTTAFLADSLTCPEGEKKALSELSVVKA